jgi:hypothetical protein
VLVETAGEVGEPLVVGRDEGVAKDHFAVAVEADRDCRAKARR